MVIAVQRLLLAGSLAALVVLTGCPSKQASAGPPAQAQAPTISAPEQPAAPSVQTGQARPREVAAAADASQRDRELIESVEKAYHAGLGDYQKGHLASARSNFDY